MTSNNGPEERFSDASAEAYLRLTQEERTHIDECIAYLVAYPEVDGAKVFDLSTMMPLMFRVLLCDGFSITYRMQDGDALIHAIVPL